MTALPGLGHTPPHKGRGGSRGEGRSEGNSVAVVDQGVRDRVNRPEQTAPGEGVRGSRDQCAGCEVQRQAWVASRGNPNNSLIR